MNSNTYFLHYRAFKNGVVSSKAGATVAIRPLSDNKVMAAIARCGRKDLFNKALGRTIAAGRLAALGEHNPNILVVDVPEGSTIKGAVADAVAAEMNKHGLA